MIIIYLRILVFCAILDCHRFYSRSTSDPTGGIIPMTVKQQSYNNIKIYIYEKKKRGDP